MWRERVIGELVIKVVLWVLSVAALLTGLALIGAGALAPSASQYGQDALRMLAIAGVAGGVCAIAFGGVVNPLLAQRVAFLRIGAVRIAAVASTLVLGAVAAGCMLLFASNAITDIRNERYVQFSVPTGQLPDAVWSGRDTVERLLMGHSPLSDGELASPDAPPLLCGFFGLQDDATLSAALELNPDFAGNPVAYRENMTDFAALLARRPDENADGLIMLAEALRFCAAGDAPDHVRAAALLQTVADTGNSTAAALLGQRRLRRVGVARDEAAAMALFQRAANAENALGQLFLAQAFERGLGGAPSDPARALALYEAAAGQGQVSAVERLAEAYATGALGVRSESRSAAAYKRLCTLLQDECIGRAQRLREGDAAARAAALAMFEAACENRDPLGCFSQGVMANAGETGPRNPQTALAAFDRGCALEEATSCFNAGVLTENGARPAPGATALSYFQRACTLDYQTACEAVRDLSR